MKKYLPYIIIGLTLIVIFSTYRKNKKTEFATNIKESGKSSQPLAFLLGLDYNYLQCWSNAVNDDLTYFTHNDKTYSTQGGKAI